MSINLLNAFLSGAIGLGYAAVALFFYRFWKRSRISLYGYFGLAFALLSAERVVLLLVENQGEFQPLAYCLRLCAFLGIIVGIIIFNRDPR